MKKATLLFCLLLAAHAVSYSQQDISLNNIVPPSPEATAFVKYGTYPIGTYTGRPDISIPLYEIKGTNLSVPISLSYDATGIRVNDMASWVGQNWSLNAGGMISQVVIGQPDINTSTGLDAVPPRASTIVNNTTYFNYLQSVVDGDMAAPAHPDADPDKFFYSFNGRSGSFVLDRNRNIVQIPKTSLKIAITSSLSGTTPSFMITDEKGVKYLFSAVEKTETYSYSYEGSSPYASASGSVYRNQNTAYYLNEIVSQEGEHIYFTYENGVTASRDDMYNESYGDVWTPLGNSYEKTSNAHRYRWNGTQRVVTIPRLKTISFANGKVEFTRVADRQDDAGSTSASRLDEISVYQKNGGSYTKLKSFKFVQGYYYSSVSYGQYSGLGNQTVDRYRLRLDAVKFRDAVGTDVSSYQFVYNSTQLPPKTSCSQDWWGYYNGKSNTTLVPTTTIPDGNGGTTTVGGADRTSDEVSMKAGILQRIIYPTGGSTYFETEAHQLFVQYSNAPETHQALALGQSSNNLVVQTFTTPSTLVLGTGSINITIPPYGINDPQPFVKIKNMSSGQEQTFTSSNNTQWYSATVSYAFAAGVTYQLTASCYVNQSNATALIGTTYTVSVLDPHTTPVGGLRIKSIKNYNSDNSLASQENYTYGPNENGGGVFVGIQGNAYGYSRNQTACYPSVGYCLYNTGYKQIFSGGALFDQALVQGSPVVYTDVVKYYGNSTGNTGKTVYNYGTASQQLVETRPLPSGQQLANNQGILIINDAWKKGQLLDQLDYRRNGDGTYTAVQENQNTYNTVYTDTTYGLIAQTKFDRITLCSICPRNFSDYAFAEYPVYSGYVQLAQTVSKLYSPDGTSYRSTTQNNTYDPLHTDFIVGSTGTNSKGQTTETTKKYPFNKADLQATGALTASESTAIDSMIARNIISPVMEEIQKVSGVQKGRKRLQYGLVNGNLVAPVNVKYQIGANPLETRIQFNKYDSYGNLTEQQKASDAKHCYIWDYQGAYPIAEVTNSDSANVSYTSFEADGKGGWTIGSATRDASLANTGRQSYSLANGNISRSGLSTGISYILSYWSKTGVAYTVAGSGGTLSISTKTGKTINGWTYFEHTFSGVTGITISGSGNIDELRLYPNTAQMTTYTYDPLVGMTSQCDLNNRITYYEYDRLQRLSVIRDQDRNVVKKICYAFASTVVSACDNRLVSISSGVSSPATIGFTAKFTDVNTGNIININLPMGQTVSAGVVPVGTYNIVISKPGNTTNLDFSVCTGLSTSGTSATFYNITVTPDSCNGIAVGILF